MLSLIVKNEPKSNIAEAYRTLRTNLQFFTMNKRIRKIILTSSEACEGKSFTTCNLAVSLSQAGKKVLIVDCDMRKPTIHKYFAVENTTGFANMIIEKLDYKKALIEYSENLHIITSGKALINPAELLNIDYISPIFQSLEEHYDIILIDTPPVVNVTDAQLLAAAADGVIMVLSADVSSRKLCQKALQLLNNVNANIIGVVLNKVTEKSKSYYRNLNYSYYGEETKKKRKTKRKVRAAIL